MSGKATAEELREFGAQFEHATSTGPGEPPVPADAACLLHSDDYMVISDTETECALPPATVPARHLDNRIGVVYL